MLLLQYTMQYKRFFRRVLMNNVTMTSSNRTRNTLLTRPNNPNQFGPYTGLSVAKSNYLGSSYNSSVQKDPKSYGVVILQKTPQNTLAPLCNDSYANKILQEREADRQKQKNVMKVRDSPYYDQNRNKYSDSSTACSKPGDLGYLRQMMEEKESVYKVGKEELREILTTRVAGLVGLNNIGNTCFMNSILQCLFNLPRFNDYFLNQKHLNEMGPNSKVAAAYARTIKLIRTSVSKSETPSEIKSAVGARKPRFQGYSQQDAQEFLTALLQCLSLDLNRAGKPKYKQLKADTSKHSLADISEEWWNYNLEREDSVVCDYFTGQLLSKVICSHCSTESIAFDNTWDFALNFSRDDNGEIQKMLENFLKAEQISSDYYCAKCKKERQCTRKLDFFRLPQILVLQLKRFSYGKYTKTKITTRVKVPQRLNLNGLVSQSRHSSIKNCDYDLVGLVDHSGDINFGHYTAICKNPINKKWYTFNDSSVSEERIGDYIQSSSPYLLFYAKHE